MLRGKIIPCNPVLFVKFFKMHVVCFLIAFRSQNLGRHLGIIKELLPFVVSADFISASSSFSGCLMVFVSLTVSILGSY
jgi:hypothetical protein